jgi:glycosyltransferase involved in cell wall biosynthesis
VLHVITDLERGGAEGMLLKLLRAADRDGVAHFVVSLKAGGVLSEEVRALGVPVHSVCLDGTTSLPAAAVRLLAAMRAISPDVVHGWMYHGNLLGGLAARMAGRGTVLWGLRHGPLLPGEVPLATRAVVRMGATLSRWLPDLILCCSQAAAAAHRALGYAGARMLVVPNGFDTSRFRPSPEARQRVRAALGVAPATPLIGLAARFHPVKDHETFVRAAARLVTARPETRFVLCGRGVDADNPSLRSWIAGAGLGDRVLLLGERHDLHDVLPAMDVATLCSRAEGFPNVVGEAMASAVPCVVTDVGDAHDLLGETGRVVPVADPAALARAWQEMLEIGPERRQLLGTAARTRIEKHFSIAVVARRYDTLYHARPLAA